MALTSTFALSPDLAVGAAGPSLRAGIAGLPPQQPAAEPSWGASSWGSCLAAGAVAGAAAAVRTKGVRRLARRAGARTTAAAEEGSEQVSRSQLFRGLGGVSAAVAATPLAPLPAAAKSLDEARAALATYGVPQIAPKEGPPSLWKTIVEPIGLVDDAEYGRFKLGGLPQIITFAVPPLWVVSTPNIDFNGAAGTVQANDYGKGDSATLFVDTKFKGKFEDMTKKDYQAEMKKALTMKGKGFIEGLKIGKVKDGVPGYKLVEYEYEIESAAGFSINRNGIASMTSDGEGKLQIFWTGVVTPRWSGMEQTIQQIVNTFRIATVPSNINIPKKNIVREDEVEARQIGV